jgi:FtsZ-interacting cell division protein YlmF
MGLFDWVKDGIVIQKRPAGTGQSAAPQDNTVPAPEQIAEEDNTAAKSMDKKEIASAILYQSAPTPPPVENTYGQNNYGGFQNALTGQTIANQNILVVNPKNKDEIRPILDNLASGNPCIVSLADSDEPQRHLDFLSGFITAINGTIKPIDTLKYILTPKGVGIRS